MHNIIAVILILFFCGEEIFPQTGKKNPFKVYDSSKLPPLWEEIDAIIDDPNFSSAFWGISIRSVETGEYFYKKNADKLLIPASNLKLFTTSAGLLLLGSNYKYKTNIYTDGYIDGSILRGSLIIQGSGDPTISGRFYDGDMLKVFNIWADSLLELGIDEIRGNILGDDNLFDDMGYGEGWPADYESYWFAAPSSALSFNDNCVDVEVKPTTTGKSAAISVYPDIKYASIINKVSTVRADSTTEINIYRERGSNIITVYGRIQQGSEGVRTYASVNSPTQYAAVTLKYVLESRGIAVKGYAADLDDEKTAYNYSKMKILFHHLSPELQNIVKVINKNSNNFYAEQLMKTIGLEYGSFGSIQNGVAACKSVWKNMDIDPEDMAIADGSGLSRQDLISPNQFVKLLLYMQKSSELRTFYESFPVAGVDGTMASRLRNTAAQNNLRGKPGLLSGVSSLSGYIFTADKEMLAFSIMVNNFTTSHTLALQIQDVICQKLAKFSRYN
jgi:D-alanyl-D-alanine carboxypeptidase/D-alanyl-D-alanine-endopeptidase (penicillin-binding protein 4)